jgi:hypothetical protein
MIQLVRDDPTFHDLRLRLEREYGGHELDVRNLDEASMGYERLSPFPESEARFLQRGYVANVEGRDSIKKASAGPAMQSAMWRPSPSCHDDSDRLEQAANWRSRPCLNTRARRRDVWKTMAPIIGKRTLHQMTTPLKSSIRSSSRKNYQHWFRPQQLSVEAIAEDVTSWSSRPGSQAIAAIRNVCWLVTAEEDSSFTAHALH